jgi:isopropylmalate/homocitrate/citramalate synthase
MLKELPYYPLTGKPYFDNEKKWVSPMNFLPESMEGFPQSVYLYDVTLRDGEQTPGVTFREDERVRIACALAELGVKRIEAAMPITSQGAVNALKRLVKMDLPAQIVSFTRAHKDDINLTIDCGCKYILIEHSVNPYFCEYAYKLDQDALAERIVKNIKMAKDAGLHVTFMGWDFTRTPLELSKQVYEKVFSQVRPDALALVDTYACATPFAVEFIFKKFKEWFPYMPLEFHVHNDFNLGVASSMAAVKAGAVGIHTAMNGIGERTGNVATEEIACAFEILMGIKTGVKLEKIYEVARLVSEISKVPIHPAKPIIGGRLFDIESGVISHYTSLMQAKGIKPVPVPFMPSLVGREPMKYVIGKGSGRVSIEYFLEKNGMKATTEQIDEILEKIKEEAYLTKSLLSEQQFIGIAQQVL